MRVATLVMSCILALSSAAIAREITPAEKRVRGYETLLPACHDLSVLEKISSYFAEKESKYWQSDLRIVEYQKIRPVAWRPWGLDTIPRRFCTGTVTISDGSRRRIDYSVREDLGIIGAEYGVEWCVAGLDRNWAYNPACKMAQP
ncbi:MAG TPA: hypothetical protein VH743_11745 [Beijerinckiaceae bacterium]|jgi:hypothetical protein